jgi:hypothetical protein
MYFKLNVLLEAAHFCLFLFNFLSNLNVIIVWEFLLKTPIIKYDKPKKKTEN